MFWQFSIPLFIASIIFPFVYALVITPFFGLLVLLVASEELTKETRLQALMPVFSYPVMAIMSIANVYILAGWSAYCAFRTVAFASHPEVTHGWLYYITGFSLCEGPLGYMASKEGPETPTGTFLHVVIAMAAFVVFCIWPILMDLPYGWLLRWLYT